jgi:hypothetical protein
MIIKRIFEKIIFFFSSSFLNQIYKIFIYLLIIITLILTLFIPLNIVLPDSVSLSNSFSDDTVNICISPKCIVPRKINYIDLDLSNVPNWSILIYYNKSSLSSSIEAFECDRASFQ